MTKQETERLLAYDAAKRNRPRNIYSSKRAMKVMRFTAARFQVPLKLRKRLILSMDTLGIS